MVGLPTMSGSSREGEPVAPAAAPDYVERALLAARELIESTVDIHRRERERDLAAAESNGGEDSREIVTRLIDGAEHSVGVVLPGSGELEDAVAEALGRLASAAGREDVAVRLLCVPRTLATSRVRHCVTARPQCEVRVTDGDLPEAVMVDGRAAWVRMGPERQGGRASLVRDRATVQALDMMFTGTWGSAVALAKYPRLGGRLRVDAARRILECLRSGHTDEVAAREMQVSLRTYRRYVAEIMRELGASSRFQAGVRAVELGLLPGRR